MKISAKWLRFASAVNAAMLTMALVVYGCYWLGTKLDGYFGTTPYLQFLMMVLGTGLGLTYVMVVTVRNKPKD